MWCGANFSRELLEIVNEENIGPKNNKNTPKIWEKKGIKSNEVEEIAIRTNSIQNWRVNLTHKLNIIKIVFCRIPLTSTANIYFDCRSIASVHIQGHIWMRGTPKVFAPLNIPTNNCWSLAETHKKSTGCSLWYNLNWIEPVSQQQLW